MPLYNPYTQEWQTVSTLSHSATSTTVSIVNNADNDGWVKVGIFVSNDKGSTGNQGIKIYNVKTKQWLY